jgi:hypothetical protein
MCMNQVKALKSTSMYYINIYINVKYTHEICINNQYKKKNSNVCVCVYIKCEMSREIIMDI